MAASAPPSTPLPLGAFVDGDATLFRLYATSARRCEVRLFSSDGSPSRTEAMTAEGDGVFSARLSGVGRGARYRFVLDGDEIDDPCARFLPDGIERPAQVLAHLRGQSPYEWRHGKVVRPMGEHVIYELHVGTFTAQGTYAAAAAHVADLAELGVTALELLPVNTFGGDRGWGYDGVAHYAPHPAYGTPDELRAFIDVAHGHGLAVFMDVVYNHWGPAGNVLPRYSSTYFTSEHDTGWGDTPDFREPWMRRYVLDNVRMWLADYRIDGLRFDAVHAIVDRSAKPILREVAEMARELSPGVVLMAEDDRNDPAIIRETGFDAVWADDFHHALHVTLTGERDGYYGCYEPGAASIARAIERGWLYEGQTFPLRDEPRGKPSDGLPASAFIYCLQNHDQVGNRALGDRLGATISLDAYLAGSMVLLFLPMTPLLFMGQEWGATTPFAYFTGHDEELGAKVSAGRREEFRHFKAFADPEARAAIPDPQARSTFESSRLSWDERDARGHDRVLSLYRALLRLRRSDVVLARTDRDALTATADGDLLVVTRTHGDQRRTLLANLSDTSVAAPDRLAAGPTLLATCDMLAPGSLPAWSAVIISGGPAGEQGGTR